MAKSGVVKFFNDEKGFGFIQQDDGGADVFVHRNEVSGGGLLEGDEVQYDEMTDDRNGKLKASNVTGGTGGESWGRPGKGGGKGYGGGGFGGGFGGGKGGGACFNCGETGHLARDCPEPRKEKGKGKGGGGGDQVCRQFQQTGQCSFGDRCRFRHD